MKKLIIFVSAVACAGIIGCAAGWFVRGLYEQLYSFKGVVHTVNLRESDLSVDLTFPSGVKKHLTLPARGERTFLEKKMGSGSCLFVKVNGEDQGSVGYVLGLNDVTVLTFHDGGVRYSTVPYQKE